MRDVLVAALTALALAACSAPSTPEFVQKAAMSDLYEIQAGRIASEKGQSEAVRQFGKVMGAEHTETAQGLMGLVATNHIRIELPTELDGSHQALIDSLNSASAEDFDKTYATQQVDAHQEAVSLFKKYAAKGDDGDVKRFASDMLATLEDHLEKAKKLREPPST